MNRLRFAILATILMSLAACTIREPKSYAPLYFVGKELDMEYYRVWDISGPRVDHSGPKICALPFERREFCLIDDCKVLEGDPHLIGSRALATAIEHQVLRMKEGDGQEIDHLNGLLFLSTTVEGHRRVEAYLERVRASIHEHDHPLFRRS